MVVTEQLPSYLNIGLTFRYEWCGFGLGRVLKKLSTSCKVYKSSVGEVQTMTMKLAL